MEAFVCPFSGSPNKIALNKGGHVLYCSISHILLSYSVACTYQQENISSQIVSLTYIELIIIKMASSLKQPKAGCPFWWTSCSLAFVQDLNLGTYPYIFSLDVCRQQVLSPNRKMCSLVFQSLTKLTTYSNLSIAFILSWIRNVCIALDNLSCFSCTNTGA